VASLLVSDREREYTVGLLRTHLLSGRLTTEEFEERVDEAWRARFASDLWRSLRWLPTDGPLPQPLRRGGAGTATASLVVSLLGLALLFFSLGLASPLALPLSVTGWALGREARRTGAHHVRTRAIAGEVMGVVGALMAALLLASCAALIAG
jgi:Domain of unknown function (DUF1707)